MNLAEQDLFLCGEWRTLSGSDIFRREIRHRESVLVLLWEIRKSGGLTYARCPVFTPYNARIFHQHPEMNESVKFGTELALYEKIMQEKLPADLLQLRFFREQVHLPMVAENHIRCSPAFNEFIPAGTDPVQQWNGLSSQVRNDIQFARQHAMLDLSPDPEAISAFLAGNAYYRSSGLRENLLLKYLMQLSSSGHLRAYATVQQGRIISASVMLRSENTWYYWLNHNERQDVIRGAHLQILWQGVHDALSENCHFSFDGSSVPSIAKIFKSLGSRTEVLPVCTVYRRKWMKWLHQWY